MDRSADNRLDELVKDAVRREVAPMVEDLRAFIERRLGEISGEIHATVQVVDYSEAMLSNQIAGIQDQVARVLAEPDQNNRNSGIELEAVVQTTEDAANRIMEAAEAINRWIATSGNANAAPPMIAEKFNTIFTACGFQDLTSQRIRRAIEHLQMVEGTLAVLASNGPSAPLPRFAPAPELMPGPELAQGEVDRLFD
jgi:chemotaxis protein CheZ